jgi:hypothetical protein
MHKKIKNGSYGNTGEIGEYRWAFLLFHDLLEICSFGLFSAHHRLYSPHILLSRESKAPNRFRREKKRAALMPEDLAAHAHATTPKSRVSAARSVSESMTKLLQRAVLSCVMP